MKEIIDTIINLEIKNPKSGLYEYFGINNDEELSNELRKIGQKITASDIEYISSLLSELQNQNVRKILIIIIAKSSLNLDEKLQFINYEGKYSQIIKYDETLDFLINFNDPKDKMECIERRRELLLFRNDMFSLIKSIGDPEYTEKCIERRKEFNFDEIEIYELIESIEDPKFIKKYIERREEFKLGKSLVKRLIKSINDPKYTMECIERSEEFNFSSDDICNLIKDINDPKYTMECIERRKKFNFSPDDICNLIKSIKDPKYTMECIERSEEFELGPYDVCELIKSIGDPEYTKNCITDNEQIRLTLEQKLILINKNVDIKYICKKADGEYIFTDVIPEDIESIEVIDIERVKKNFFGFKLKKVEEDFIQQINLLIDSGELMEKLERNNFSLQYILIEQLNDSGRIKQFCSESDFRFFKSEFPNINDMLLNFPEEERLDFLKFATSLGCFSTEKMLDKKGKETQVLLAQKASSLLAQLLKTEEMTLR